MSQIPKRVANRKRHGFLLARLSDRCADPCKDDVVNAEAETDEEVDAEHPSSYVQC